MIEREFCFCEYVKVLEQNILSRDGSKFVGEATEFVEQVAAARSHSLDVVVSEAVGAQEFFLVGRDRVFAVDDSVGILEEDQTLARDLVVRVDEEKTRTRESLALFQDGSKFADDRVGVQELAPLKKGDIHK